MSKGNDRNSLLWQIRTADRISWLFGTMHVRDRRAHRFTAGLLPILEASSHFYAELDLDEMARQTDPSVFMMPGDTDIRELLGEKKYRRARERILRHAGLDLDMFRSMLPLLVINLLSEKLLSADHRLSLDQQLWQEAKEMGLETGGVEEVSEQLGLLRSIPLELQARYFWNMSRNLSSLTSQTDKLAELYTAGQIHRLYRESARQMGRLRRSMIFERNFRMAERIRVIANRQSAFFALGAGHLSGGHGLLHLLNQKGIQCRPVQLLTQ